MDSWCLPPDNERLTSMRDMYYRYYRTTYNPSGSAGENDISRHGSSSFEINNSQNFINGEPTFRYSPAGFCIYCKALNVRDKEQLQLSDEHIIAEGLGGKYVLPESSCTVCSKLTCNFEAAILKTVLYASRVQLNVQRKKRKRPEDEKFPLTIGVAGVEKEIDLGIGDHPSILLLLYLNQPRALLGLGGVVGHFVKTFGTPDAALKNNATSIHSPRFDSLKYCQLLAKIAHSYAVARLRIYPFKPLLTDFIRQEFQHNDNPLERYDYIGGYKEKYSSHQSLHTIGHEVIDMGTTRYLVITIRLFAFLGTPIYRVVVGEMR